MQAALKKAEELKAKKLKQLELYTNDIIKFGLWYSEKAVDQDLESKTLGTVASKINALKAQLRLRQYVVRQDAGSTPGQSRATAAISGIMGRIVNHDMNMHYVDVSCEHALWSWNKRVLQPLLHFENCRVKST